MPFTKHNLLPADSIKFRENSADSVVYHLENHTSALPHTMTITRSLPVPRKGNAGTMKIFINVRKTVVMATPDGDRAVPLISKLETSLPVGCSIQDFISGCFTPLSALTGTHIEIAKEQQDLFQTGLLPDNTGVDAFDLVTVYPD